MKYQTKVFHEVSIPRKYSIINKIAQQELNDSQSKNRRSGGNETPNLESKEKKLITKMKKHIRITLPENIQTIVIYQSKKLSTKFNVKDKKRILSSN